MFNRSGKTLQNKDKSGFNLKTFLNNSMLIIVLIIFIIFFSILEPAFISTRNIFNIILQVSILSPIAIGMTLVILTGGIDLSVGSVLAFSQAVCAGMLVGGKNMYLCVLVAMLIGMVLGLANGLMIAYLKLPPFIATLGMMSMARGFQQMYTMGSTIYNMPEGFRYLGTAYWFGIPAPIYLVIILFIIFALIMKYTAFGRSVYAVGGNPQAAKISGISVNKVTVQVYTIAGFLVSLGAILQLIRLNAHESSAGNAMEMDAIACVVIGGTSMSGGRGSIARTALGTLIYGVIINGLNIAGVSPFIQKTIIGALIILAVTLDTTFGKKDKA